MGVAPALGIAAGAATEPGAATRAGIAGAVAIDDLPESPEVRRREGVLRARFTVAPATVTVAGRTFTANIVHGAFEPPDALAINKAYLNSLAPVAAPRAQRHAFPYDIRPLLGSWKELFLRLGAYQPNPT